MSNQFVHNGVIVPPKPAPRGLALTIRGESRALTPHQEEMAIAWARKIGTDYVQDPGFVKNFMRDFSAALGFKPALSTYEVDFDPAIAIVQTERVAREQMTPEDRKAMTAQRKAACEELKEKYGHATLNGERVELGNYMVEPSGIFMGRGKHPLRGKWKDGALQSDITLNLSPDAPRPVGEWAGIVWQPESLWVAKWEDKLAGKVKYVWLADTAPVKQEREAAKFDKAVTLDERLADVRAHIETALADPAPRRREVATACYLIDALCMRVGDEKDEDEADTVGATTLRPEHITLHEDGTAEFRFLGKDSVLWHKKIQPPPVVMANLAELIASARPGGDGKPQVFPAIDSGDVNAFLGEALPGLTAKVFRTHHATEAVRNSLTASGVTADDPEYKKVGAAAQANLEAAILCNHFRKAPANWKERRAKSGGRKDSSQAQVAKLREQAALAKEALSALRREAADAKRKAAAKTSAQRKTIKARYDQRIAQARKRLDTAQARLDRAETSLGKLKVQDSIAAQSRTWNLGTSLKSYIDPRVYYRWGQQVGFDVLGKYYPKTLQRKFAWARE